MLTESAFTALRFEYAAFRCTILEMATLAAPGFYATPEPDRVSLTASFTGRSSTIVLLSPLLREFYWRFGLLPEALRPKPGQSRLVGSFGGRRGRRLVNTESR